MRRVALSVAMVAVCSMGSASAAPAVEQQWSIGAKIVPSIPSNENWKDTEAKLIGDLQRARFAGDTQAELKYALNLGYRYWERGIYNKALPLYVEALDVTRKTAGISSPEMVICLNNLGLLHRELGHFAASRRMHEDALEVLKNLPNEPRLEADTEFALGLLGLSSGNYSEAQDWLDKAAPVIENSQNRMVDVARFFDAYAKLYILTGRMRKAEAESKKSWSIADRELPRDSTKRIQFLDTRASVLFGLGRYSEAEKAWTEAVNIADEHGIGGSPDIISLVSHLGELYVIFGDAQKAEQYLNRSLQLLQDFMGPASPTAAAVKAELGFVYARSGDMERARESFDGSLGVLDKPDCNRPLDLAMVLIYYGEYLRLKGRWQDAYDQFKRAAEIRERILGEHPLVALALQVCADACKKLKKKDEARAYAERAEEMAAKFPETELAAHTVDLRVLKSEQSSSFARR